MSRTPCADPENAVGVGGEADLLFLFFNINVFYRGLYGAPSRSNWSRWVQLLLKGGVWVVGGWWRGFVPELLKKPISADDFPGEGGWRVRTTPSLTHFLNPPMYPLIFLRLYSSCCHLYF